jgi:hypothetical protein
LSDEWSSTLQLSEDMRFQDLTWRLQRFAWLAFTAVLAASLAGLFGDGPLARVRVDGGGTRLAYDRFARRAVPTSVELEIDAPAGPEIALRLAPELARHVPAGSVFPPPVHVEASAEATAFRFRPPVSRDRALLRFELAFDTAGLHDGWLTIDASAPLRICQWVYP